MKKDPFEIYTNLNSSSKSRNLDWEESALDEKSDVEGFLDENRPKHKFVGLKALVVMCCAVLSFKLFDLQIMQGDTYRLMAEGNRIRNQVVLAPRGLIKDRNGELLAQNIASYNLFVTPFDLPKEGLEAEVKDLAATLSIPEEDIWEKIKKVDRNSFQPSVVMQDLTQAQSILFETKKNQFIGFAVHNIPIRQYFNPLAFSHLLGYAGIISSTELEQNKTLDYQPADYIGKYGIELSYEKFFKGINGQNQIEVDAKGNPVKVLGQIQPEPGNVVELNIDKGLQEQLYNGFEKFSSQTKGAAVALNPKTGEVLALVSAPGFDNNLFAHGIKQTDYQNLLNDKNLPLFNRAIAGTYPPGSTAKMMVAIAALEQNIVTDQTVVVDRGQISVPNQYNNGTQYIFRGWKPQGLGPMTVRSAIAMSSDIYFYEVSGGSPNGDLQGMGAEKLAEYYRKFNLGKVTGIDLQGEKAGLVPDPAWKAEYFKNDPVSAKWYLGDTYHLGIGQGDLLATPLQVAQWTATIANNGTSYKPNLLKAVYDKNGKEIFKPSSEVLVSNIASAQNFKIIQEGMREGVLNGTGRSLSTLSISSASKTGTSQFDGSDPSRTHAWFTVYAPYEDPKIVITILVEAGGEGNAAALPIAKQTLQWWADNRLNK